jgi:predicted ester cyclase
VLQRLRRAFPDIQYRIDAVIESGDRTSKANGTHRGEYLGIPPAPAAT